MNIPNHAPRVTEDAEIAQRIRGCVLFLLAHIKQMTNDPLEANVIVALVSRGVMAEIIRAGLDPKDYPELVRRGAALANEVVKCWGAVETPQPLIAKG